MLTLVVVGCDADPSGETAQPRPSSPTPQPTEDQPSRPPHDPSDPGPGARGLITLAFVGDMHFERRLGKLLERPRSDLGAITTTLRAADITMANLEAAITRRGIPDPKELELPDERYHFRAPPTALDFMSTAGIDVVSVANNHGADYGRVGLDDTLDAAEASPIPVVGVGRNAKAAFEPYRVSVRGTDVAVFAADASMRESTRNVWAAGPQSSGIAAARKPRPQGLLDAVRAADSRSDLVAVYLHWGEEYEPCPSRKQVVAARALARAGADVIVGSHAHVLLGSGWLGDAYVNYGLANFLWYHNNEPATGVLELRIRNGHVVDDSWAAARIQDNGVPHPLTGQRHDEAVADWRRLRDCTGLSPAPPT